MLLKTIHFDVKLEPEADFIITRRRAKQASYFTLFYLIAIYRTNIITSLYVFHVYFLYIIVSEQDELKNNLKSNEE